MRFAFTEEQDELRRQARRCSTSASRRGTSWRSWAGSASPCPRRRAAPARLRRGGGAVRGARAGALPRAVLRHRGARAAAALPDEQALVASGERKYEDSEVSLDGPVTRTRAFAALAAEAVGIAQKALELASSMRRAASSSASRSASTRPSPTPSSTRTSRPSSRGRSPTGPRGASRRETTRRWRRSPRSRTRPRPRSPRERSIQVHGGIGFTWEHPLHRYYKRAQWIEAFGGYPAKQRRDRRQAARLTTCDRPRHGRVDGDRRGLRTPLRSAARGCWRACGSRGCPFGTEEVLLDVTDAGAIASAASASNGSTGSSTTPASPSPHLSSTCRSRSFDASSKSTSSASWR